MDNLYIVLTSSVAGLCAGFGLLYLFVGLRRAKDRRLHLFFALFALCYAATLLLGTQGRTATTTAELTTWSRIDGFFIAGAYISLVWFVSLYTVVAPRWLLWGVTLTMTLIAMANAILPNQIYGEVIGLIQVALPWDEEIALLQGTDSAWSIAFTVVQLAVLIYILTACALQFRRGDRQPALVLGTGLLWFTLLLGYELLGEAGIVPYLPLGELGFLGIATAMSLRLTNSTLQTEIELGRYRGHLEEMVAVRTAELESAQEQIIQQVQQSAVADERNRLARELHDSVTQTLYSVSLVAAALPRLLNRNPGEAKRSANHLRNMTLGALAELRTLLYELRPEAFEQATLGTLVQQAADVFTGQSHLPVNVSLATNPDLPSDAKRAFYRITQEALNNAGKHGGAATVDVTLTGSDGTLVLCIEDDGQGFESDSESGEGMGISIMRERAQEANAELKIISSPNGGTSVMIRWPTQGNENQHAS